MNNSKPRLVQLDILRGLAILLVLGAHAVVEPTEAGVLRPLATLWRRVGWTGVDLFFVLSGFLIGGLLFAEYRKHRRIAVGKFLIRRGFKIWPLYFTFLAFLVALYGLKQTPLPQWLGLTYNDEGSFRIFMESYLPRVFSIQNYIGPEDHTWSLAVEEHFYLALPILLLLLAKRSPPGWAGRDPGDALRLVPIVGVGIILACNLLRVEANIRHPGCVIKAHQTPTHIRIDSLYFGVILAYFYNCYPSFASLAARNRATLILTGVLALLPVAALEFVESRFVRTFGLTLLYLGYGSILMAMVATDDRRGWAGRCLRSRGVRMVAFIGVYSYPIYLWHLDLGKRPILELVELGTFDRLAPGPRWVVLMAAYGALSVLVGFVAGKLIERPALALRERFFPSDTRAVPSQPAEGGREPVESEQPVLEKLHT